MTMLRCRIFYLLAVLCGAIILLPYPGTVFMGFCFSCLSLPFYRRLRILCHRKQRTLPASSRIRKRLYSATPLTGYVLSILLSIFLPILCFVIVVAPQVNKGIVQLKEMAISEKLKPLMPGNIGKFLDEKMASLKDIPVVGDIANEMTKNIENLYGTISEVLNPTFIWQKTVGFLGGTMSVLWLFCLFIILTILFTIYAREAKCVIRHILDIPITQQKRFISSIRRALSAVMLGIIFVALIQGVFCGIGFAVAGVESPAFWGLLAAFVAPIPMIGTALVWGPLAIMLWFQGAHFAAFGLVLWGILVISNIDSLLRPFFLQQGINAPFTVLIVVMICGLHVFGPIGLIAAPTLLAFALTLLREGHLYLSSQHRLNRHSRPLHI